MQRKLYHGSNKIIEKPQFEFGKLHNDYGLGFYCTEKLEMAKEWGVSKDNDGFANCYVLGIENLSVLNLNDNSKYNILNWLSILLENRVFDTTSPLSYEGKSYILKNFKVDYQDFDIITGYKANDSYFSFAQDFLNGTISLRQLSNAMKLGKLGTQVVLKSKKAFENLKFTGYEIAKSSEWFEKKEMRDKNARREYFDTEKNKRQKGDIYITQIPDSEFNGEFK